MHAQESDRLNNILEELRDSNLNLADDQPDITGWKVKDTENHTVGEVNDLLIDTQTFQVRYLLLDMEGNDLNLEARNVLIPIGLVELYESHEHVVLQNITVAQLKALPVYIYGKLTREKESAILNTFSDVGIHSGTDLDTLQTNNADDFYKNEVYFNSKLKLASNDAA